MATLGTLEIGHLAQLGHLMQAPQKYFVAVVILYYSTVIDI